MLPKAHSYEPDEDTAGLPIHFRCWDAFRAGRERTVLITEQTEHGQVDYVLNAVNKHARAIFEVSPCASHHLGAVRGNPGIVGMLRELGNKVFRHVGLPPEHDFQCGCPLLRRCGCFSFCIRHGIASLRRS